MSQLMQRFKQIAVSAIVALGALALFGLSGCGGGLSLAGVGTGGSGLAEGTISGFGSVIVDGVEYDDTSATVQQDDGTGVLVNADLKLGQRVRLSLDGTGKALSVAVLPQLVGPVSSAQDGSGNFQVMGQLVRLAGSPADTTQSTPAALEGFAGARIAVGDQVEVHGTWVFDSNLATCVLIASRVEKLAAAPALIELSGIVYSISGNTLRLNGAAGTTAVANNLPAGLATGDLVHLWTPLAALTSNPLAVSHGVDATLIAANLANQTLALDGQASNFDPVQQTVSVQGINVKLPSGLLVDPAAQMALSAGKFVSLQVRLVNGSLMATSAALRGTPGSAADMGQSISIKAIAAAGSVDWTTNPVQFQLRGVNVSAAQAMVAPACSQATAGTDLQIEVAGRLTATGDVVIASAVKCLSSSTGTGSSGPGNSTIIRAGSVTQVDLPGNNFTLLTLQGSVSVQWDTQTFFPMQFTMHPERLTGLCVEVEGVNQTGMLRARKVKPIPCKV